MQHASRSRRTLILGGASVGIAGALALLGYLLARRRPVARPEIISRAGWGALAPDHNADGERGLFDAATNPSGWQVYAAPLDEILRTVVVHHSALRLTDGPYAIQRLHMANQRFADIGYHFVIDSDGRIYEGRSIAVRGAHTEGHNTGTVGICLLGNFETREPPTAQLDALRQLVLYLRDSYSITHLAGHRDFLPTKTVCPGALLERLLPPFAADLALEFGTGGYVAPFQPPRNG